MLMARQTDPACSLRQPELVTTHTLRINQSNFSNRAESICGHQAKQARLIFALF